MKIVTAAEMREIDRLTTEKYGVPSDPVLFVRRVASPPSIGTDQRSRAYWKTMILPLVVGLRIKYRSLGLSRWPSTAAAMRGTNMSAVYAHVLQVPQV